MNLNWGPYGFDFDFQCVGLGQLGGSTSTQFSRLRDSIAVFRDKEVPFYSNTKDDNSNLRRRLIQVKYESSPNLVRKKETLSQVFTSSNFYIQPFYPTFIQAHPSNLLPIPNHNHFQLLMYWINCLSSIPSANWKQSKLSNPFRISSELSPLSLSIVSHLHLLFIFDCLLKIWIQRCWEFCCY